MPQISSGNSREFGISVVQRRFAIHQFYLQTGQHRDAKVPSCLPLGKATECPTGKLYGTGIEDANNWIRPIFAAQDGIGSMTSKQRNFFAGI